ncbi:MAG: imelysin family protein [Polyangiaceae bacterium]|nr:imelysin family protein [Polyangiaceae bacterium]
MSTSRVFPNKVFFSLGSLVLFGVATFSACSSTPVNPTADGGKLGEGVVLPSGAVFTRKALLESVGACVLATTKSFETSALALDQIATEAVSDESKWPAVREQWKASMRIWQELEMMQLGPALMSSQPGGKEYRDAIYSWPLGGRCLVEQNLVSKGYESPDFLTGLVTTRGMLTAEYLLFHASAENACASTAAINSSGTWAALVDPELASRKRGYTKIVIGEVAKKASELRNAWDPAGENFVAKLGNAGTDTSVYKTDQQAFNSISDALFYLEFIVKDMKVGEPAGIRRCTTPTCPEFLESQFAGMSKEYVQANVAAFGKIFRGCEGNALGFDDFLRAAGGTQLADDMEKALKDVEAALVAIPETDLKPALVNSLPAVKELHAALKRLTDLMKTQFASLFDFEIPVRVEGDND